MENTPLRADFLANHSASLKVLLIIVAGIVFGTWLYFTPAGLMGKADAAGYAVCHRITTRSFFAGDRQTPLCARCSGMYLGALLGGAYLSRYGRRAGMPPLKISLALGMSLVAFGLDGANSYLHFFPSYPGLYEPQNWLRLLTGTGLGLGIAAILVPVVHQSIWTTYDPRPALAGWRQFLPLLGLAVLLDIAILSEQPILLYPLAFLSALAIFLILTTVYTIVWLMASKRENRFQRWRDLWVPLLAGFLTALVQIGVLDALRFWLTGTWEGFLL